MPVNKVLSPNTLMNQMKVASGIHSTVTAVDVIATGLKQVQSVVASLGTDPADGGFLVSAAPHATIAGSITVKTWQNTSGSDPTPAAAAAFSKSVSWIAVGI